MGIDAVASGLVASYSRPGGNATGATLIMGPLGQKRLEIVRELRAQSVRRCSAAVNQFSPDAAPEIRRCAGGGRANGLQLRLLNASTQAELDAAFASLRTQRSDALLIGGDPFFLVQRHYIVEQVARVGLPAVYGFREMVEAGGLISYGSMPRFLSPGRHLCRPHPQGRRSPPTCRCMQPTKFELVINLKTAKALGLDGAAVAARPRRRGDRMMGWMAPLRHLGARLLVDAKSAANREPSMGEITTIGLDLAKHVFQVHGVDADGATVLRKQLRRGQVLAFFGRLPRCRGGPGGVCDGALLGAGVGGARPRGAADAGAIREGLRQAQQERRGGCGRRSARRLCGRRCGLWR